MDFTKDDVKKVANLARLGLTEAETASLGVEMTKILSYIEKLNNLDTGNIDPSMPIVNFEQYLRDDQVRQSLGQKEVLKNAPEDDGSSFLVPKII